MVLNPKSCKKLQLYFSIGKSLSTQNLTEKDKQAIQIVENHPDGWFQADDQWKLVSYRDQLLCRAAENKNIPKHIFDIIDILDDGAQDKWNISFAVALRLLKIKRKGAMTL